MQTAIISTGLGIVLFLCLYLGFRTGLRLGMQAAKGQMPPKYNLIKDIKETLSPTKPDPATNELLRGYANMMAATGDPKDKK